MVVTTITVAFALNTELAVARNQQQQFPLARRFLTGFSSDLTPGEQMRRQTPGEAA